MMDMGIGLSLLLIATAHTIVIRGDR